MELILDTNIYRNLVRNLTAEQVGNLGNTIKDRSKQKGITLFFPIHSAMELICHLNDDEQKVKEECKSALNLLVMLSTTNSLTHIHVDFIPPLNAILERLFFGTEDKYAKLYGNVITLAQMLVGSIEAHEQAEIDKHIKTVKDQIEFEKREIKDNYENYLKSINNGDADWEYFKEKKQLRRDYFQRLRVGSLSFLVAQSIIDRAYNIIGKEIIKDQDYHDKVITFMQEFCPALTMNELLLANVGNGVDAIQNISDNRWNTVIDISLIFGALYNTRKVDKRLVTEEKNIHSAFDNCGFKDKILNLADFKNLLDL